MDKREDKKQNAIFTKEFAGMVLILFATLLLVCMLTGEAVFSTPGQYVCAFMFGTFGYAAFAVIAGMYTGGIRLVTGKKIYRAGKKSALCLVSAALILLLINTIMLRAYAGEGYGGYLAGAYEAGANGIAGATAGGALFALAGYLFAGLLGNAGAYAVEGIFTALALYFTVRAFLPDTKKATKRESAGARKEYGLEYKDYPVEDAVPDPEPKKPELYVGVDNFELKTKKQQAAAERKPDAFKILYPDKAKEESMANTPSLGYSVNTPISAEDDYKKKIEYIKTPTTIDLKAYPFTTSAKSAGKDDGGYTRISEPVKPTEKKAAELPPMFEHDDTSYTEDESGKRGAQYERYSEISEVETEEVAARPIEVFGRRAAENAPEEKEAPARDAGRTRSIFGEEKLAETNVPEFGDTRRDEESAAPAESFSVRGGRRSLAEEQEPMGERKIAERGRTENAISAGDDVLPPSRATAHAFTPQKEEEKAEEEGFNPPVGVKYNRPPLDLFKTYRQDPNAPQEDYEERSRIIERTLSEFGIDAQVVNYVHGPTVTRYELSLPAGVPVKKVPNHADDIAMRLESATGIRIEAPIPGKNLVGVEVPNKVKTTVGLRDILESDSFRKDKPGALTFALGKNLVGEAVTENLAKGPHYLVAGSTGMGKSVCLNSMIISLITKYSPEELRLILVDPKQVEFNDYEHLPHLMIDEIITNAQKAIATLQWAVDEMESRYAKFRENGVRDINEYNESVANETIPKVPKVVIIVDEVSDLMQYNRRDLEAKILSLSQKARAAGIHLVLATQRPSVDVITGVIKANLPSRIAFRVSNAADSATILSESGAEKLLGNGDMLYKNAQMPKCERVQGSYISSSEVKGVVAYIKEHNECYFNTAAAKAIEESICPKENEAAEEETVSERGISEDKLFIDALRYVITAGSASISMLQRRFSVGYSKAGSLVDQMDRMGYISPFDGARARQVLITKEQFEEKYGAL